MTAGARRVFLVGSGPLPVQDPEELGFPALRARQFLLALLEAGHEVAFASLVSGPTEDASTRPWRRTIEQPTSQGPRKLYYHPVRRDEPGAFLSLRDLRHEFEPDVVVSAGPFAPMAGGARAAGAEPLWVDVPGDPMSEAQLRAYRSGSHDPIHRYRQVLSLAVTRGDHFSVVSQAQRPVLIGALGLAGRGPAPGGGGGPGRLTAREMGRELVHVIPVSLQGLHRDCSPEAPQGLLTGIAPNDFTVLICGGYNTWMDEETLVAALLQAMDADPHVHLVSTGGGLTGHNEGSYQRFRRLAERSKHATRFHFLGWVPTRHLDAIYGAADLAVNMDLPCYEAEFGSRTRLLDAMERGLPAASTVTCDLTRQLREVEGFFPLDQGDSAMLASLLIRLAGEKRRRLAAGGAGVTDELAAVGNLRRVPWSFLREQYSIVETTRSLLKWVQDPVTTHEDLEVDFIEDQWAEIARLQERLEEVWRSPTWRYLGRVHKMFKGGKD